jgi:hypothetical protein
VLVGTLVALSACGDKDTSDSGHEHSDTSDTTAS